MTAPGQGWSFARFRCGSCGHTFTAVTEAEYIARYTSHTGAHSLLAELPPSVRRELARMLPDIVRLLAAGGDAT